MKPAIREVARWVVSLVVSQISKGSSWSVKQLAVKPSWLVILFINASESVGQTAKGKGRKKDKLVLQVSC